MRLTDFVGMDAVARRLSLGVAGGEAVHAYLFCGPAGTGKRSMAAIFARALNCTGDGDRPCDECASCQRYLAGTHPDHIVLSGDKTIKVDDVRALIERVSNRPFEGGRHTILVEDADRMTPQAQNALLKTLEEPPGDSVFILTAATPAKLLPTILSRTRRIRFSPLSQADEALALTNRGISADRARLLSRVSLGSVGRALALDKDDAYWALRERALRALSLLRGPGDVAEAFALLKDDKDEAAKVFEIFEGAARAAMEARETGTDLPEGETINCAGDLLLSGVFEARRMLAGNVSWQSTMERLFFTLTQGEKEFDS